MSSFYPTNLTTDLGPRNSTPYFLLNGTEFAALPNIELTLLAHYADIDHKTFLETTYQGKLINIDTQNYASIQSNQFAYISCDPSAYPGTIDSGTVYEQVVTSIIDTATNDGLPWELIIIFYSRFSDHCAQNGLDQLDNATNVFTTVGAPGVAANLAGYNLFSGSPGYTYIRPDKSSYSVYSAETGSPEALNSGATTSPLVVFVGGGVGGVLILLMIAILIYCVLKRRKNRRITTTPQPMETKPEMYAGPVDQEIAGPVKPKQELRATGTIQRKAVPGLPRNVPEIYSTTIEELGDHERPTATYYPQGRHELGSEFEDPEVLAAEPPRTGEAADASTINTPNDARALLPPTASQTVTDLTTQQRPLDPASAAEADFAVQELGLISMRKRTLAELAAATGKRPEEMDGRAGEQYRELLEREGKLRRLLDEMQTHGD